MSKDLPTASDGDEAERDDCPNGNRWCEGPDTENFPCWPCYRDASPEDQWGPTGSVEVPDDEAENEPISDLMSLREGDRVLWDGREIPLLVVRTTYGSHILVEGPNGGLYQVLPDPRDTFPSYRLARGGAVRNFRRVERATPHDREFGRPEESL